MKVAFDTSILDFDRAGSAMYARKIVEYVAKEDGIEAAIELRSGAGRGGPLTRRLRHLWQDLVWAPFLLPWLAARRGADVLHCPAYRAPLASRLPRIVTVHDVYPLQNPRSFRPWWAWYFRRFVAAAAKRADLIITSSSVSANEIAAAWDIEEERIRVVHYGVGEVFDRPPTAAEIERVRREHGLPESYFLFVGSLEPRKNLSGLLQAARRLRQEGKDCRVVIVGPRGWRNRELQEEVALGVEEGWLSFLGFVDDADLAALYAGATALVMPSFHEGFGFPIIEAMGCGCPVIAGRAGSLPEITADAGLVVDPADIGAIGDAMARIVDDDDLRADLVARGRRRSDLFRWERCARQTVQAYRELLSR